MKTKKIILTGTAIASVLALSVGITWAAFSAKTTTLNVVTMGNVHINLIDKYTRPEGGVGPGDKIAKIVSAKNTGKNTEWVRISVDKAWCDPQTKEELDKQQYNPDYIVLNIKDPEMWVDGDDGYWYYQKPLEPGQTAENLMESFSLPADWDMKGYTNLEGHITVQAEAIQYDNFIPERNPEDKIIGWHDQTVQEALPEVTYSFTNSTDDSNVTFQYGTHEFVVLPDSTDLFGNFKGVMPGDSREQSVIISNQNDDKVKIWVYALPADISHFTDVADRTAQEQKFQSDELLRKLELTVTNVSETGSETIFEGPLVGEYGSEPTDQRNAKYLGEYAKGDSSTLKLTLKVPEELDNYYDDAIGKIQWVFVASNDEEPSEEPSKEPSQPSEPSKEPSEEPSEPSKEPSGPSEPSEPSKEPSEPSQPSEPSKEPSEPSEPSEPESSEPSDSGTGGSIDVSTPDSSGGNNPAPNEPLAPPVQTGQDANEYIIPIIIVLVSLVTVVVLLLTTRKKKRDDDNT